MEYNIDIEAAVTDKYKVGHDYKVKVLVDEEVVSTLDMTDYSITSPILDLENGAKVKIIIYFKNRDDEEVILEEKDIIVEYPEDFISHKEEFESTYDLEFESTLGDDGFNFNINTNLDKKDDRDYYIIDIYDGEELLETKETNDTKLSFVISYDISEVKVTLTEVKKTENYYVKYEKNEYTYSFEETRSEALNPTGSITVTDDIDNENEIYNLDYEIEVTDLYRKGTNYRLLISVGNLAPQEIELDGYSYSGKLEDLGNNQVITFELYATINGDEILIESKEKEIVYADDFVSYDATYEINEDSITSGFTADNGFDINISSSFSNNGNESQKYIVRVYHNDTLLDEKMSDEESVLVNVSSEITDVDIKFVPVKERTSGNVEFEESVIHYNLIPFNNIQLNMNAENVIISLSSIDEVSSFDMSYEITLDSGEKVSGTKTFSNVLEETIDQESKDIGEIKVSISYDEKVIRTYTFNNDSSSEVGEFSITEEGYIKLPIDITLPDDSTFISASIVIDDGAALDQELESVSDEITITEISKNTLSGFIYYSYKTIEGYTINKAKVISIDLNASIDVDYFASFVSSVFYANLDFKSMLGDDEIDADLDIEVYNQDQEKFVKLSTLEKDAKFYSIAVRSKIVSGNEVYEVKYKVNNTGFDNEEKTITFDSSIVESMQMMSGDMFDYSFSNPRYVTTTNADDTVNYYFDTGATLNKANQYLRIEGSYQEAGVTKYYYSPFITDTTYVLENMVDNNYEFNIGIYYLSGGIYYRTKIEPVTYYVGSSAYIVRDDSIYYDTTDNKSTIEFSLKYDGVTNPQNIKVTAGETDYLVNLRSASDLDDLGSSYNQEETEYSYQVTAETDYTGNYVDWKISLTILNKEITSASVTYSFAPTSLTSKFEELSGLDLGGNETQEIAVFRGNVNVDNISITPSVNLYEGNKLTIKNDFESSDYRDSLRYEILSDGKVISTTDEGYQSLNITFGSAYTIDNQTVTVRISQVKDTTYGKIVYETILEKEITFEKNSVILDSSITKNTDGYTYHAVRDSSYSEYDTYVDIIEYYSDGSSRTFESNYEVTSNTIEVNVDHSSDSLMPTIERIEVRIRLSQMNYEGSGNTVLIYSYELE